MTQLLNHIEEIIDSFKVAVLDQWGVLHNGKNLYPNVLQALTVLEKYNKPVVLLSNSGRRASINQARVHSFGIEPRSIQHVITSGEVLWQRLNQDSSLIHQDKPTKVFMICTQDQDAWDWLDGLKGITPEFNHFNDCSAMINMGIPSDLNQQKDRRSMIDQAIKDAIENDKPMICSNPDLKSPQGDDLLSSPGTIARRFSEQGGKVWYYGKPHQDVFDAVKVLYPHFDSKQFLMVGDSMEHDILGAEKAGFQNLLIRDGIHKIDFKNCAMSLQIDTVVKRLTQDHGLNKAPNYSLRNFS